MLDADNDGSNDIFVCNGINRDLGDVDFLDFFFTMMFTVECSETAVKREEMDEILKHLPVTPLPNRVFKTKETCHLRMLVMSGD